MKSNPLRNRLIGIVIFIVLISLIYSLFFDSEHKFSKREKEGKFAIFDNRDRQLTGYIYDEVYGSSYRKPEKHTYEIDDTKFPYFGFILVNKCGKFAYLNEKCEEIVKFGTYDYIMPMNYYGCSIVRKGNKWGILNKNCKLVTPLIYDKISQDPLVSYENPFKSFLAKTNNKYRILNENGEWKLKTEFNSIEILPDNLYLARNNNKLYLINDNCSVLSDSYSYVSSIDKGFIVKLGNNVGVIDDENNILIPFSYDSIFAPHLEPYYIAYKNAKSGVLNLKGEIIVPFEYENIGTTCESGNKNAEEHLIVQRNKLIGTISFQNKAVIPIEYDKLYGCIEYGPNAYYAVKNNKWGLVSYEGKVLIPITYDYLHYYADSLISCKKNGKNGVIDIHNKEIVSCNNDSVIIDYFFIPAHDKNKYKIIVKKNGVWKYLSLKGKLIKDNVPESTVKKDIE